MEGVLDPSDRFTYSMGKGSGGIRASFSARQLGEEGGRIGMARELSWKKKRKLIGSSHLGGKGNLAEKTSFFQKAST